MVWFGDLLDIRVYEDGGQDLYVRMAASEFGMSTYPIAKDFYKKFVLIAIRIQKICIFKRSSKLRHFLKHGIIL